MTMLRSVLVLSCALLGGCATVAPYERELLADPSMILEASPVDGTFDHARAYREAALEGGSVGTGGCGCN